MPIFSCFFYSVTVIFSLLLSVQAHVFTIGTEDLEYYPYYGKSSPNSADFGGFAKMLFEDFGKKNQLEITYSPQPVKRLYQSLLLNETIDFKYPDSPYWNVSLKESVNKKIFYSLPISSYIDGTFVHRDNKQLKFNHIKSLGIIRGFTPEAFKKVINNGDIVLSEFSHLSTLLKMLNEKQIDAIYLNVEVAKYQMKMYGFTELIFNANLPLTKNDYYLSTVNHPEVIDKLNQYIIENEDAIKLMIKRFNLAPLKETSIVKH